jgi:hypothetical protein
MRWAFIGDGLPFQLQKTTTTTTTTSGRGGGGGGGGSGGDDNVEHEREHEITTSSPSLCRIDNAALSGDWHYRVEAGQWPGHSRLWHTC